MYETVVNHDQVDLFECLFGVVLVSARGCEVAVVDVDSVSKGLSLVKEIPLSPNAWICLLSCFDQGLDSRRWRSHLKALWPMIEEISWISGRGLNAHSTAFNACLTTETDEAGDCSRHHPASVAIFSSS